MIEKGFKDSSPVYEELIDSQEQLEAGENSAWSKG
jgi:hypothetical protein